MDGTVKFRSAALFAGVLLLIAGASGNEKNGGWAPKFYPGLEAGGSVEWLPNGYKGKDAAVRLKWESGAMKFGVMKNVTTELSGLVDWTISAQVKSEGNYGYAGAAMEFFDEKGRSLGVVTSPKPAVAHSWRRMEWTFSAPKTAKKCTAHLLSLNREPVLYAKMSVTSKRGRGESQIPFEVAALPAEWNKDWNGGTVRMLNFTDAPIPVSFYVKGRIRELANPKIEVDIPESLEVKESCSPLGGYFEKFVPQTFSYMTNGERVVRYSFINPAFLKRLSATKFRVDEGVCIKLVVVPKSECNAEDRTFTIRYRTKDGEKTGEDKSMEMVFRRMPRHLKKTKDFFVFSWNNVDRHFVDDGVANAAANAYEAAGIRSFRRTLPNGADFGRKKELAALYAKRPVKYLFSGRFGDLWSLKPCGLGKSSAKKLGVRMAVCSDEHYAEHVGDKMCPEYFITDSRLKKHLRKYIHKVLSESGVADGDWVTFDMEPWHSSTWCHCSECHKAFAAFAGLDHIPDAAETQTDPLKDKWATFRCRHNERSVELVSKFIKEYNPTLKCIDYDYIMPYGDDVGMKARRRLCGKDTFENEKWLDGHLCSYYHTIDRASFLAMKNNVRFLRKFYVPMAAMCGYGSYLRPGEVLSPQQMKQFAVAAFVNGCPGYAVYSGVCYDGEMLIAMMKAQDEIVRYEGLPWGKVDGKCKPKCENESFASASTVMPDGTEVVALFNYESDLTIRVALAGREYEIEPYGVRFVEVK